MVRFFLVTISDFRAHPISSAGPSSSNDICIYIYIYTLSFTVSGTVPPPCFSCAASCPGRTAFLFPRHTCFCHSPDVFLRKRNAGRTWCTSFFTGFIVTVSLLWVFFCAWSSFDGLKRNVRNRIIGILVWLRTRTTALLTETKLNYPRVKIYRNQLHTLSTPALRRWCMQRYK